MTRAWFRRRLDADPRRWVLLLAALEGLAGFALQTEDRFLRGRYGAGAALWLGAGALAPATGVLLMVLHGRFLWWTGKLLRGRATPREIHAAFAWSALPLVIASAPLVIAIPVQAAARFLDPAPAALRFASDLLDAVRGPVTLLAGLAALAGAILYVRFLAEAQRFGSWRALANHALAVLAFLGVLVAIALLGAFVAESRSWVRTASSLVIAGALATAAALWLRGRRADRARAPTD